MCLISHMLQHQLFDPDMGRDPLVELLNALSAFISAQGVPPLDCPPLSAFHSD